MSQSAVGAARRHVLVVGGGVVGVSTAYQLLRAGLTRVTLVEGASQVASREHAASFANAAMLSPGIASPWAAPDLPPKLLRYLLAPASAHLPLRYRLSSLLARHPSIALSALPTPAEHSEQLDTAVEELAQLHECGAGEPEHPTARLVRWGLSLLRECAPARFELNQRRMRRLAEYSSGPMMAAMNAELGWPHYDYQALGTLELYHGEPAQAAAAAALYTPVLRERNVPHAVLTAEQCLRLEPGLALAVRRGLLSGGLHLPNDQTGNCLRFTEAVAAECERRGAQLRFGRAVRSLLRAQRPGQSEASVVGVRLADGEALLADAVVLAAGVRSVELARAVGLELPVYPVKGYSLTLPITDAEKAPRSTMLDAHYKVAITRLGDQVRVGGLGELADLDRTLYADGVATLRHVVTELFPGAVDLSGAQPWTGLRPMTPDGTPIVGATSVPGLYLNTGHGTLGWTMAAGSARVLADLLSGREPEIDVSDLSLARYRS